MKKWLRIMPAVPSVFSLLVILCVYITMPAFDVGNDAIIIVTSMIGPMWLMVNLFVCPILMPLLQGLFSKVRWWHFPVFILSNVLGSVTYFVLYELVTGQSDPEGALLAVCEPIAVAVITAIACLIMWLISHNSEKKKELLEAALFCQWAHFLTINSWVRVMITRMISR
ncbi:MAG: hypothetical protein IJW14_04545 [Oscillospiraceae bacterium]|nr:hypothetical protein [Oscillospiraceae bacterium]